MERKDGVVQRVAREINNEVILASHPDFEIDTGLHPAGYLTTGRPIDMTLYIDLSNEFKHLYEIGELDSWVNKYSRKIPVAGLEVQFHSPVREPAEWLEVASQLDGDIPRIQIVHNQVDTDLPRQRAQDYELVFADLTDAGSIRSNICPVISSFLMDLESRNYSEIPHVEHFLENVDYEIYHREEVARAYKNGQTGLLIILLSVFFESYYYNELLTRVESLREREEAGPIIDDETPFGVVLNQCRYFGLVKENEYRIVNSIKDSRNDYAHDIELYHQSQETPAERDGIVEDAVRLYENILDAEKSIIDN